jgi:signal transduction histidine kinase
LELGKMQVSAESIDINRFIDEVKSTFGLESKNRKITIDVATEGMDGLVIRSDRGLLQLIVENFLSNAIKYGDEGTAVGVTVVGNRRERTVTLSVSDTGIGIPDAQRANIGKKLFRGDNARLASTDGNGLGLYISHIAAESIGATIDFESTGKLTRFSVTLPAIIDTPPTGA